MISQLVFISALALASAQTLTGGIAINVRTCPTNAKQVQCFVAPCTTARCGADKPTCFNNYCGGCKAECCAKGFKFDSLQQQCVPDKKTNDLCARALCPAVAISCAPDMAQDLTGCCVTGCVCKSTGKKPVDGKCSDCPDGQFYDKFWKQCVPDCSQLRCATAACEAHQILDNRKCCSQTCVDRCPGKLEKWSEKQQKCVPNVIVTPPQCKDGEAGWNQCNACTCVNGLFAACTRQACPECNGKWVNGKCESIVKPCVEGTSVWNECNRCSCTNGLLACTKIGCLPCDGKWIEGKCSTGSVTPVCKEGSVSWNKCNRCSCSNGQLACTKIGCPACDGKWVNGQCQSISSCKEGASSWQQCNQCTCSNGQLGCTEKACPACKGKWVNGQCESGNVQQCEPGKPAFNQCNSCSCSKEGQLGVCTLRACPPCKGKWIGGKCVEAGCSLWNECNSCSCNNGIQACTKKGCPACKGVWKEGKCYEPQQPCVAGETKKDGCKTCRCEKNQWLCSATLNCETCKKGDVKKAGDGCNTCTCDGNGNWACTKRACLGCKKGDVKKAEDGCNTCTCDGNGNWACTKKACPPAPCTKGDTKKADDGCNTCTCDGRGWACTEKACITACPRDARRCPGTNSFVVRSGPKCLFGDCKCKAGQQWNNEDGKCEGAATCTAELKKRCFSKASCPGSFVTSARLLNPCCTGVCPILKKFTFTATAKSDVDVKEIERKVAAFSDVKNVEVKVVDGQVKVSLESSVKCDSSEVACADDERLKEDLDKAELLGDDEEFALAEESIVEDNVPVVDDDASAASLALSATALVALIAAQL